MSSLSAAALCLFIAFTVVQCEDAEPVDKNPRFDGVNPDLSPDTNNTEAEFMCCFPSSSTVMTPNGPKLMDELEIGDRVMDRNSQWTTVYTFQHKSASPEPVPYVEIHLVNRQIIRMSSNHLIFRKKADGQIEDVTAASIRTGDTLFVNAAAVKVSLVYSTLDQGKYAPITFSGSLIVDGIWASCYATSPSRVSGAMNAMIKHQFVHDYAWAPLRVVARLIDGFGLMKNEMMSNVLDPGGNDQVTFWYIRMLEGIASIF